MPKKREPVEIKPKKKTKKSSKTESKKNKRSITNILNINDVPGASTDENPQQVKLVLASDTPELLDPEMKAAAMRALAVMSSEQFKEKLVLQRDLRVLETVVTEYLKSFMIIGYGLDGEKISIFHATNPQEADSIVEHARGTLMSVIMKAQQNLPGMGDV